MSLYFVWVHILVHVLDWQTPIVDCRWIYCICLA